MLKKLLPFGKLAAASLAALLIFTNLSVLAEGSRDNFKIDVVVTADGTAVVGVEVNLASTDLTPEVTKELTTTGGNNRFNGLSAGNYTLTIVFPTGIEYELATAGTGTKTVKLSETNQSETVTFLVKKKAPPVDENWEKIKAIKLPEKLTKIGSTSTDFSKLNKDKLNAVENFTLDNPGVNKIVYLDKLNLSNFNDFARINLLGDYIDLETAGKVKFDTDLFSVFNKKARITMYNIKLVQLEDLPTAIILRNGVESSSTTNVSYSNNQLSFDVDGFSTYTLKPQLVVDYSNLVAATDKGAPDTYKNEGNSFKFVAQVDNLDAKVTVYSNGNVVNIPTTPAATGRVEGDITLASGNNRIRVEARLPNGEKVEEFFTVTFEQPVVAENGASNVFGIIMFLLILLAGGGLAVYYFVKLRKKEAKKDAPESEVKTEPKKPNYDPNLLTDEEKQLYDVETPKVEPSVGKLGVEETSKITESTSESSAENTSAEVENEPKK